jgi:hypothetical protein
MIARRRAAPLICRSSLSTSGENVSSPQRSNPSSSSATKGWSRMSPDPATRLPQHFRGGCDRGPVGAWAAAGPGPPHSRALQLHARSAPADATDVSAPAGSKTSGRTDDPDGRRRQYRGSADGSGVCNDLALAGGWRGILSGPMLRERKPIGTIGVIRERPGRFSDAQVELLRTFADQAVTPSRMCACSRNWRRETPN